jgi:hypothetical protein
MMTNASMPSFVPNKLYANVLQGERFYFRGSLKVYTALTDAKVSHSVPGHVSVKVMEEGREIRLYDRKTAQVCVCA